jgi:23S rRNA pseudouridine1911/1915/1917 synthase
VERLRDAALLRVQLATGRTHPIRVQLAEAGWPVLGDEVYGAPLEGLARQALHAARLTFPHPASGARIECEAPLPDDLRAAIERLKPR